MSHDPPTETPKETPLQPPREASTNGSGPVSERVRVRRGASRATYDRDVVHAILDAGLVAHVGVATDDGPIVLPMAYGRTDDWLYLHGSAANAAMRAAVGHDVCVTVTLVDGLLIGRSPFHNSMHYRAVIVRGVARRVDDPDEHIEALRLISDHVVATWDTGRAPTDRELRKTLVLAVPLVEVSAKVREGDPADEPEDLDGPHWGGSVPIHATWGEPVPSSDLRPGIDCPPAVLSLRGSVVSAVDRGAVGVNP
jgi:nitroimidazol reductase NimA-like FMN-containing flavoprotein (pyridoxamine 5'-phosphate oxidase superfamily)